MLKRLKRLFVDAEEERIADIEGRLNLLNTSITRYPDMASGYVLRGEMYLKAEYYQLAADDFQIALDHAKKQYMTDHWGVVAQAMQDRARTGLEQALQGQRQNRK